MKRGSDGGWRGVGQDVWRSSYGEWRTVCGGVGYLTCDTPGMDSWFETHPVCSTRGFDCTDMSIDIYLHAPLGVHDAPFWFLTCTPAGSCTSTSYLRVRHSHPTPKPLFCTSIAMRNRRSKVDIVQGPKYTQ